MTTTETNATIEAGNLRVGDRIRIHSGGLSAEVTSVSRDDCFVKLDVVWERPSESERIWLPVFRIVEHLGYTD